MLPTLLVHKPGASAVLWRINYDGNRIYVSFLGLAAGLLATACGSVRAVAATATAVIPLAIVARCDANAPCPMGQMHGSNVASGEAVNICRPSVASGINGNDGMGATGGCRQHDDPPALWCAENE